MLLALDSDPGNVRGNLGEPVLFWKRAAIFFTIHRERTQNSALRRENGCGPTSLQSTDLCKLPVIGPKRIGHDIGYHNRAPPVHRRAARAVAWSDWRPVHRFHVRFRQMRRRAMTHMFAIAVEEKNRTAQS